MTDATSKIGASYAFPPGGLPDQAASPESTAIFTTAYALLPAATMRDIVTSLLPGWYETRAWILARPLTGFAESFAQYAVEVAPNGGSDRPEPDVDAQAVLFVTGGDMQLQIGTVIHALGPGGYAYIPPRTEWRVSNPGPADLRFHWIRKRWTPVDGVEPPEAVVSSDRAEPVRWMHGADRWGTTRFVDPEDMRHDCHVNIVTFLPGGRIPFAETHVMEHGLYVLQGTGKYLLNTDWVEVGPGDFMWLRAFCPQACIATGEDPFRYLLYKDVNRHPELGLP